MELKGITWATYTPNSIISLCYLHDGERWVAVTAGGDLLLRGGTTFLGACELPERGSPRSLATHPSSPHVAVGIKQGGFSSPASVVLLIDADSI